MKYSLKIGVFLLLLASGPYTFSAVNAFAETSKTEEYIKAIEEAKGDLATIIEKLSEKLDQQVKAGDTAGARNTQLRFKAANDLANMLAVDSQKAGDVFFKIHLIEGYNGILNITDFSAIDVREAMNYRMVGPDQLFDNSHITQARLRIDTEREDMLALRALQDKAQYFASQQTYEDMLAGFQRGGAAMALSINDGFADINPASNLLQAALGVNVSGEKIGQDMTTEERLESLQDFFIELALDVATDKVLGDAVKGIGTRVGTDPGSTSAPRKGKLQVDTNAQAPDAAVPGSAGKKTTASGDEIIGRVDLSDVDNVDDMIPFTDLDNFSIDLRTGQVTTSKSPGGRISPADQSRIDNDLNPQRSPDSSQTVDVNQGTAATAFVKPPSPNKAGEQVIGRVDLEEVNEVFDMVGLTHLDNFNIDLRTGQVTTNSAGGRIGPADQAIIETGLKPQGPLGGDQKIDLDFHNAPTEIDIQGMTTVNLNSVYGGTYNKKFADPQAAPGLNKPRDEIKPIWDILDLIPDDDESPEDIRKVLPILIYAKDPKGGPRKGVLIKLFAENEGWSFNSTPTPPSDPFSDCLGPQCVPSFGGPGQPFGTPPSGADFHTAPGGPGTQFVSDDSLLNDPFFFNQRFGELFDGASPTPDTQNQPN